MADGSPGPSHSDLSALRSELLAEIRVVAREVDRLRSWTEDEINRLESEMREVGVMIVDAINRQTMAVVGGVAATTVMIERTKQQIEEDFSKNRNQLQMQLESTLQIEIGKKVADVGSSKSKLDAFISDIKSRFDKSIEAVAINRELYNVNFRKITDEYENKIQTIGAHIFQVKLEDIAPAIKAAQIPYEAAHGLPIELDLKRLSARSANLDESLELLKSSRLDEVVASLRTLEDTLAQYSFGGELPKDDVALCVEGLVTTSALSTRVMAGRTVAEVADSALALETVHPELSAFETPGTLARVELEVERQRFRDASGPEIVALIKAAAELRARNLISADSQALLGDFLGSGNLKYLEA